MVTIFSLLCQNYKNHYTKYKKNYIVIFTFGKIKFLFILTYSSHNDFRIKSEIKLSEYNCNQDLVSSKTENQIGFSIDGK